MRNTQLECIVFRKKNEVYEFLLMKRIPKKGGFWQPPCGGLDKEDVSKFEAAHRELLEEASITKEHIIRVIEEVDIFIIDKHYLTGEPISKITEYVYGFEVNPDVEVSIHNNIYPEHEEFRWVTFEKALEMLKWNNNKEAFIKLNLLLNSEGPTKQSNINK
jgi:8-oxo-dGTP pyrophosphatase MutT (NUDIX family)